MIRTDATNDPRDSNWIEALHAAITTDTPAVCDSAPTTSPDEFDEVRDCLHLLHRLRHEQRQTGERPRKIGRFKVVREVGRGGFGVVLAAIDPRVGRQVAIKIPRPEVLATHSTRSRFLREAQAAGVLSHPNLIAIHEVGEDGPVCYIVSELCHGTSLAQWLAARERPLTDREAAEIAIPLARAVAHAHRRGVLHRDIKPSNVLLEPSEPGLTGAAAVEGLSFRPLLTDFGLARIPEFMEEHTCTGTLLGTPAYMAPEQAEGRIKSLTPATDIYALGVILYELLTGQPPLRGETDLQTLQLVAQGDVPQLRSRRPQTSRDLAAIVHKCLETTPARRYASADDLADDLERFLSGQPTKARPTGLSARIVKWCRRRPLVAALAAVILVSVAVSTNFGWQYLEQRRIVIESRRHRQQEVADRLYVASMNSAADALVINRRGQAHDQLAAWIPENGETDRRSFGWHYLNRQLDDKCLSLRGHTRDIYRVEYSPDGKRLATASADGTARIWDATTGECLQVLRGHEDEVNCITFHPTGRQVATASDDGQIVIWDLATGNRVFEDHRKAKRFGVAFSPNGENLATCSALGLGNRSHESGEIHSSQVHHGAVGAVVYSKSGKWFASASEDGTVLVRDTENRDVQHRLSTGAPANHVAISNDDKWLVASNRSGRRVRLFDLSTMTDRGEVYPSLDWIHAVAFHPDNEFFAVSTKDGSVDFVELASGNVVHRLRGHDGRVWSVAFHPDGRYLATAGADGVVKIWDLQESGHDQLRGPRGSWLSLTLTPSGQTAIALHANGEILAVDVNRRITMWNVLGDFEKVGDFNGDGHLDSALYHHGAWRLALVATPDNPNVREEQIHFGQPGDWPVVGDWDGDGQDDLGYYRPRESLIGLDMDGRGGHAEKTLPLHKVVHESAVPISARWPGAKCDSPGLAVFHDGESKHWEISFHHEDGWREFSVGVNDAPPTSLPLFGRWQLGSESHQLGILQADKLWSIPLPSGPWVIADGTAPYRRLENFLQPNLQPAEYLAMCPKALAAATESYRPAPRAFSISPDSKIVAIVFPYESGVRITDASSGLRIAKLSDPQLIPTAVSHDPGGAYIFVGTAQGVILQYDAKTLHLHAQFQPHQTTVNHLYFSGDGQTIASVASDGVIALSALSGKLISTLVRDRHDSVTCLALSYDGTRCAICSPLRPVGIYRTDTGKRVTTLVGGAIDSRAAAFSNDGRTLATSGEDRQVILWDTTTWEFQFSLPAGDVRFAQLLFDENDSELSGIGAGLNGELRVLRWRGKPAQ